MQSTKQRPSTYGPDIAQPKQHSFKNWGSIDTSANRQALKPEDFSWLENWMQVGPANLQTLDGPSNVLASTTGGDAIYEQFDVNLNGNDVLLNICSNGSGYAMPTASAPSVCTISKFAPNGTFDGAAEAFAQWQNTTALFIGPTGGYWAYNGTTLINLNSTFNITGQTTGGNLLTVSASPAGFIISPGMTFTGTGISGSITILSYGTGNGGNGTINSANGNYNVTTTANVGPELMTITQGSAPTVGTAIATYAGRVWIANGRTITYSAPGSYTDFTVGDAGGAFTVSDSSLYGNITSLIASNNYLYFGGLDSINVISDVRIGTSSSIVGGTVTTSTLTLFTNTNISTNIGIPYQGAVAGYLRSLVWLSKRGPYILAGSAPQKMGNNLDGIMPLIDFTKPISCCISQVNLQSSRPGPSQNIITWGCTYNDPVYGPRYIHICFFDGKWFLASQVKTLTPSTGVAVNWANLKFTVQGFYLGTPALFGTDGTSIYMLYINDNQPTLGKIQTALWNHGDPTIDKQVMKLGIEANYPSGATTFFATVDTELSSISYGLNNAQVATWLTATNAVSTWYTVTSLISVWTISSYAPLLSDVSNIGKYYGFTVYNGQPNINFTNGINYIPGTIGQSTADVALNGLMDEHIDRARW